MISDATVRKAVDTEQRAGEILRKNREWTAMRQPHESDWFTTAAMLRGQQHVVFDQQTAQLIQPDAPSYAVRIDFNKMLPKHRARMAKFLRNRPKVVVAPASTEFADDMDARATERVLDYQWARLRGESAYREARQWASVCYKSFWCLGYDENAIGHVKITDPFTGEERTEEAVVGDVTLDVANAWEFLVADPNIYCLGKQPEIQRVRAIGLAEAKALFPTLEEEAAPGTGDVNQLKHTEDRIGGITSSGADSGSMQKRDDKVVLIEHYYAPCAKYPKGAVTTVCSGKLVKHEDELPFGFYDSPHNPYPFVDFSDSSGVGQFWNATWNSQHVPLQRTLNRMLELILENAEAVSRPKWLVYAQHQIPDGAITSSAGEVVTAQWLPGLPEPRIIQAQSVAGDLWNVISVVLRQFDDMSQIQTASEGGGSGQSSGYQTNLLQEANDAVHAPDIRGDELAIEDWAWKCRRIMKRNYDLPRLFAIGGEDNTTEMLEFGKDQISDAAEVRVQIGSMLPDLKAARAQTVLNYYKEGLFGDPNDPNVKRKVLTTIEAYGMIDINRNGHRDEDEARRENQAMRRGEPVELARFWHRHVIHIEEHEAFMKTPEFHVLPPDLQLGYVSHLVSHYDYMNPEMSTGLKQQYGLVEQPSAAPPPPMPGPGTPAGPAPPSAAPPPAPAPPGPPPVASGPPV